MVWERVIRRGLSWRELEREAKRLTDEVKADRKLAFLLLAEPTPTFTFGRHASPGDLLWDSQKLAQAGVDVHEADRGGKWTYHGPGQVILFPIFSLREAGYGRTEIRRLMDDLREATAGYLATRGISTERRAEPFGLYADSGKLVSFGIAVHEGICQHGLALYVRNPARSFAGIHSCGVREERFSSLEDRGAGGDWENVAGELAVWIERLAALPERKRQTLD